MTDKALLSLLAATCLLQLWLSWRGHNLWELVRRFRLICRIRRNLGVSWRTARYIASGRS